MRCFKSCYFKDLELVNQFDNAIIEQVVFFRNDFLVDRTADFCFSVSGCPVAVAQANECTNIYFEHGRGLCQPSVYLIALNLKSLSYAM